MSVDSREGAARADSAPAWRILQAAGFGALILAVCWASIEVPRDLGRVAPIWPANALILSLLLALPRSRWPAWVTAAWIGNLAANLLAGDRPVLAFTLSVCNVSEVMLSALAVRRFVGPRLDFSKISDFVRFAFIAGLASPLAGAAVAAVILGRVRGDNAVLTLIGWAAADGLGAVIGVPLVLTLCDQRRLRSLTPITARGLLALAGLALVTLLVFSVRQPLAFMIPPAMLLVVFELELLGAAWGVLIVLVISAAMTAAGLGPALSIARPVADVALVAQLFLAAIVLTSFPTAAALAQRRRLQADLAASAADLVAAKVAAETAARVKSEFLANMSHEIRTPLTSIIGFTSLLAEQPDLGDVSSRYLARVENGAKALLATVNDVLDFTKLEAGQIKIERRPLHLETLTAELVQLFEPQSAVKGVALRYVCAAEAPDTVLADAERLRQILINLVGNAVKFTEAGSVTVAVGWTEPDVLRFEVTDTGVGVSQSGQAQLFQRFSQVDGSTTRSHGGTGLGLAICKGLVEAMGGEIGVESKLGKGSRFWFQVPAARVSIVLAADRGVEPAARPTEGARVLVVDDNAANRELALAVLGSFGLTLMDAADGFEAIAIAEHTPLDLILMDIRMPGMDGVSATRRIRAGGGLNAGVPILAFTADVAAENISSLIAAGFDGHVAKPVRPADLFNAVAEWAGERAAAPADADVVARVG
jgi:signal transduction histidine kinase/ActR/RegA family two-component response regulator